MALNINGTTGISGVDGSASAPAVTGTDSNTGINFASDTVNINTGGTTRATVDSSGDYLFLGGTLRIKDSGNTAQRGAIYGDSSSFHVNSGVNNLIFYTGGGERMRIGSDGFVGIAVTSDVTSSTGGACFSVSSDNRRKLMLGTTSSAGRGLVNFFNSNGEVGSISTDGSSTAYNTSSDYRLKENVVSISDGITRLKTLKPSRFNFIADATKTVDGFLAHEVTAVPDAITGTKDEVVTQALIDAGEYKEGTLNDPIYQGIDQSKLVPLLTAALQEAIAKIEVLETKVAALEAG